ncbi:MAG: glycine zipper family protein [Formivibrio sp.]|nr:glycine zipper family protein [Formivibrio sp.]
MKSSIALFTPLLSILLLAGCVSAPIGPTALAMPGKNKTFEQFRSDDAECRQYAGSQTGGKDANQASIDSGVTSAAVGTALGALAGAAFGGHNGAAVGAGGGLLVGSLAGTGAAQTSARRTQQAYDNAYIQCMYAKGEQVPVPSNMTRSQVTVSPAYIEPDYPSPGEGWVWEFHPRFGWGWHHPDRSWHRGWR